MQYQGNFQFIIGKLAFTITLALTTSCQTKRDFTMAKQSAEPGGSITWIGEKTELQGKALLKKGDVLPSVNLVNLQMAPEDLETKRGVKIISVVPSLDTPVCDLQTHELSESRNIHPSVERITISSDLPYAIRRFREQSKLKNIRYLSDYRSHQFAESLGLKIKKNGILARAVIVADANNRVIHYQIVPEISHKPDMAKAIAIANDLVEMKTPSL